ncbi:MAG: flagellar biosynthesis/type III secretory pathway protein [Deltaproteobacteria bacterium]|nr:MAG: flagellar biosynthesis/type III secretory pathway protein [Deltaproteobacteria bacterium]
MSLSDIKNEKFEPIDVSSLDSFDEEHSNNMDKSDPDFDRFKMLFEKPKLEKEKSHEFEPMYDVKEELEEIIFKPLIKRNDEPFEKDDTNTENQSSKGNGLSEKEDRKEPEETPEEKGYREGFEKGLEQGTKQGHEEGLKKGEAKGHGKGEQQGIEKGEKQGFEQGLKDGEQKATNETREKGVEIISSLEESLKKADQTLDLLVEKYEERIISLIQQIAEKAVMAQIEINDEIVKNLILDALKALVKPEEVVLSVCQDDYDYIDMIKDEFFEVIDSLNSVSVRSDASIKRGGCKIDTVTASISADPESRLEAIFEAIKKVGAK